MSSPRCKISPRDITKMMMIMTIAIMMMMIIRVELLSMRIYLRFWLRRRELNDPLPQIFRDDLVCRLNLKFGCNLDVMWDLMGNFY